MTNQQQGKHSCRFDRIESSRQHFQPILHCLISYSGGLGMSPCIMGLTTQDPYIQKEHTELYKILKFRVNCANIEQDTAIQKL